VPIQLCATTERPAHADAQVDEVGANGAPGSDPAVGRNHHAIDHPRPAEPVEANAQIRILHDRQAGIASANGEEVSPAKKHRMIAE